MVMVLVSWAWGWTVLINGIVRLISLSLLLSWQLLYKPQSSQQFQVLHSRCFTCVDVYLNVPMLHVLGGNEIIKLFCTSERRMLMHYMNLQTKMHMHETWINAQNQRNIYDGNKFQVCNQVWQREYFIYLCDGAYLCMHAWTVFSFKVQCNFVQHHYLTLLLSCFKPSSQFQLGTEMIWPNIKKIQHKINE